LQLQLIEMYSTLRFQNVKFGLTFQSAICRSIVDHSMFSKFKQGKVGLLLMNRSGLGSGCQCIDLNLEKIRIRLNLDLQAGNSKNYFLPPLVVKMFRFFENLCSTVHFVINNFAKFYTVSYISRRHLPALTFKKIFRISEKIR
jgi:hypothetical protein